LEKYPEDFGAKESMIIDCNAFIGHYPFRRLSNTTVEQMVTLMDRNGIGRSIVSALPAVFYRDAHSGNRDLWEAIEKYQDRFVPIATVNPRYVGWEKDLEEALVKWKMKGVTLVPAHHGYSLTEEIGQSAIQRVVDYGVPLILTQRFEDRRQRHPWDVAEDLEVKSVIEIAQSFPRLKLMLCNWIGLDGSKLASAGLKGRCLIDFARLHVILNRDVPKLIESLGIEAIAFGSHAPFDYLGPSLVKLANLESLPADEFEKISWRNAVSFFQLTGS
jgi:predicted TIM-barrel fold metal-dependent hydrolase